tara:strand:+ start:239 stop:520 length:282 start_codon:yes stop_codon:yes gene_type:complete
MHNTQTKPEFDFHQEMVEWGREIDRHTHTFLEEVEKEYAWEAVVNLKKFKAQNEKHFKLPLSDEQKSVLEEASKILCQIHSHMGCQTGTDGWE